MAIQIIINKAAGNNRTATLLSKILPVLKQDYPELKTHYTLKPGDARKIAEQIYKFSQRLKTLNNLKIIVVGGDGTLHDVINGLQICHGNDIPVGYVPTGTGNDFARAYNIPLALEKSLNLLLHSNPTPLPIGHIESSSIGTIYFMNSIGIGVDARIVYSTNNSKIKESLNRWHLGQLSYIANAFQAITKQKGFEISWTDDQKHTSANTFLFLLMNHPYVGGGVRLLPHQLNYRASLNLVHLNKLPWRTIMNVARTIIFGKADHPALKAEQSDEFIISSNSNEHIEIDGETFTCPFEGRVTRTTQMFLLPIK